jgi:hypothetical protein
MTESQTPERQAPLDGNALAGAFSEVFVVDVTTAMTRCVECRRAAPVAELDVYLGGPGAVARCRGCGYVVARLVRTPTTTYLDLRGTVCLAISDLGPAPSQ